MCPSWNRAVLVPWRMPFSPGRNGLSCIDQRGNKQEEGRGGGSGVHSQEKKDFLEDLSRVCREDHTSTGAFLSVEQRIAASRWRTGLLASTAFPRITSTKYRCSAEILPPIWCCAMCFIFNSFKLCPSSRWENITDMSYKDHLQHYMDINKKYLRMVSTAPVKISSTMT